MERLVQSMDDKDRQQKRARTVRSEYSSDLDTLNNWIQKAEIKVRDKTSQPQILKQSLQEIQSELPSMSERLDKLILNANIISENCQDADEVAVIKGNINTLSEQLNTIKSWLDEKKQQIGDCLDSWERFMTLYNTVMNWAREKQEFVNVPLVLESLADTKSKLHDYNVNVKSCKNMGKTLSEMSKELEIISENGSIGDLSDKMEEAEAAKVEVEAKLLERNALLHETSEEWEQCERKLREVRSWYEKTKGALDAGAGKKKPLRDQLAAKEKIMADVSVQKTKISVSVEKLQVHFKCGLQGAESVVEAAEKLKHDLESLYGIVKQQSVELEAAIDQVEQYQQELLYLKQEVITSEQKLRTISSPAYLPHDRETAAREQNALKNSILQTRDKIHELMVLLQKLDQLGTRKTELGFMSKLETVKLNTDSCSYADIAAGRASPCRFDGSPVSKPKIHTNESPVISDFSEIKESSNSYYCTENSLTASTSQIVAEKDNIVSHRMSRLDLFQLHTKSPPAIIVNDEKDDDSNDKYKFSRRDKEPLSSESVRKANLISGSNQCTSQSPATKIHHHQNTEGFLTNEDKKNRSKSSAEKDAKYVNQESSSTLHCNSLKTSFSLRKVNKLHSGTRSQGSSVSRGDSQKLSLPVAESKRSRSKSPVWIPGESASYSDIVKGNSRSSSRIPSLEDLTLTGSSSFESGFDPTTKIKKIDSKRNIKPENEMKNLLDDDIQRNEKTFEEVSDGYFLKVSSGQEKYSSIDNVIKEYSLGNMDQSYTFCDSSDLGSFRNEKIVKNTEKILHTPVNINNKEKIEISNEELFETKDKFYHEGLLEPPNLLGVENNVSSTIETKLEIPTSNSFFKLNEQQSISLVEKALPRVTQMNFTEISFTPVETSNLTDRSRSPRGLIVGNELTNLSLLTVESKRSRSKSPIWIPGQTASYSDIVKGNSRTGSRVPSFEDLTDKLISETELKSKNVICSAVSQSQKVNRKKTNNCGIFFKGTPSATDEAKSIENTESSTTMPISKDSDSGIIKQNEIITELITEEKSKETKTLNISVITSDIVEDLDSSQTFKTSNIYTNESNPKKGKKVKKKALAKNKASGTTLGKEEDNEFLASEIIDSASLDKNTNVIHSNLMESFKSSEIQIKSEKKDKLKKQKKNTSVGCVENSPKHISCEDGTNVIISENVEEAVDGKMEVDETMSLTPTFSIQSIENLETDPGNENVEGVTDTVHSCATSVKSERKKKINKKKSPAILTEIVSGNVEKVESKAVKNDKICNISKPSVQNTEKSEIDPPTDNFQESPEIFQNSVSIGTTMKNEKKKKSKKPKTHEVSDNEVVITKQEIDDISGDNVLEADVIEKTLVKELPSYDQTLPKFEKLEIGPKNVDLQRIHDRIESSGSSLATTKYNKKKRSKKHKSHEVSLESKEISEEDSFSQKNIVIVEDVESDVGQEMITELSIDQTFSVTNFDTSEIAIATTSKEIPGTTQIGKKIGTKNISERKNKSNILNQSGTSDYKKVAPKIEEFDVKQEIKSVSIDAKVVEKIKADDDDEIHESPLPVTTQKSDDSLAIKDSEGKKPKKQKLTTGASPDEKASSNKFFAAKQELETKSDINLETGVDVEDVKTMPSIIVKCIEKVEDTDNAYLEETTESVLSTENEASLKSVRKKKSKKKKPKVWTEPSGTSQEENSTIEENIELKPDDNTGKTLPFNPTSWIESSFQHVNEAKVNTDFITVYCQESDNEDVPCKSDNIGITKSSSYDAMSKIMLPNEHSEKVQSKNEEKFSVENYKVDENSLIELENPNDPQQLKEHNFKDDSVFNPDHKFEGSNSDKIIDKFSSIEGIENLIRNKKKKKPKKIKISSAITEETVNSHIQQPATQTDGDVQTKLDVEETIAELLSLDSDVPSLGPYGSTCINQLDFDPECVINQETSTQSVISDNCIDFVVKPDITVSVGPIDFAAETNKFSVNTNEKVSYMEENLNLNPCPELTEYEVSFETKALEMSDSDHSCPNNYNNIADIDDSSTKINFDGNDGNKITQGEELLLGNDSRDDLEPLLREIRDVVGNYSNPGDSTLGSKIEENPKSQPISNMFSSEISGINSVLKNNIEEPGAVQIKSDRIKASNCLMLKERDSYNKVNLPEDETLNIGNTLDISPKGTDFALSADNSKSISTENELSNLILIELPKIKSDIDPIKQSELQKSPLSNEPIFQSLITEINSTSLSNNGAFIEESVSFNEPVFHNDVITPQENEQKQETEVIQAVKPDKDSTTEENLFGTKTSFIVIKNSKEFEMNPENDDPQQNSESIQNSETTKTLLKSKNIKKPKLPEVLSENLMISKVDSSEVLFENVIVSKEDPAEKVVKEDIPRGNIEAKYIVTENVERGVFSNILVDSPKIFQKSEPDSVEANLQEMSDSNQNEASSLASSKTHKKKKSKKQNFPEPFAYIPPVTEKVACEKSESETIIGEKVKISPIYPPQTFQSSVSASEPTNFQDTMASSQSRVNKDKYERKKKSKTPKLPESFSDNKAVSSNKHTLDKSKPDVSSDINRVEADVREAVEVQASSDLYFPISSVKNEEKLEMDSDCFKLQETSDSIQNSGSVEALVNSEKRKKSKKHKPQNKSNDSGMFQKENPIIEEIKEFKPNDNSSKFYESFKKEIMSSDHAPFVQSVIESEVNTDLIKVYCKESDNEDSTGTSGIIKNYNVDPNASVRLENMYEAQQLEEHEFKNDTLTTGHEFEEIKDDIIIKQVTPALDSSPVENLETAIKVKKGKKSKKQKLFEVLGDNITISQKEEPIGRLDVETKIDESIAEVSSMDPSECIKKSKNDPVIVKMQEIPHISETKVSIGTTAKSGRKKKSKKAKLPQALSASADSLNKSEEEVVVHENVEIPFGSFVCCENLEVNPYSKEKSKIPKLLENISVSVDSFDTHKAVKPKGDSAVVEELCVKTDYDANTNVYEDKLVEEIPSKDPDHAFMSIQKSENESFNIEEMSRLKNFDDIINECKLEGPADVSYSSSEPSNIHGNSKNDVYVPDVKNVSSFNPCSEATEYEVTFKTESFFPDLADSLQMIEIGSSNIENYQLDTIECISKDTSTDQDQFSHEKLRLNINATSENISDSCLTQPGLFSNHIVPRAATDPYLCNKMGAHEVNIVPPSADISKSSPEPSIISDGQQVSAEFEERAGTFSDARDKMTDVPKPSGHEEFMASLYKRLDTEKSNLSCKESYAEVVKRSRDPSPVYLHKNTTNSYSEPPSNGSFTNLITSMAPNKQDSHTVVDVSSSSSKIKSGPDLIDITSLPVNEFNTAVKTIEPCPDNVLHNVSLFENDTRSTDYTLSSDVFINSTLQTSSDSVMYDCSQYKIDKLVGDINFAQTTSLCHSHSSESELPQQQANTDIKSHHSAALLGKLSESFPLKLNLMESNTELTKRSRESSPAKAFMNPFCKSVITDIDPPCEPFPTISCTLTVKGEPHTCFSSPEELQSDLQKENLPAKDVILEEEIEVAQESVTPDKVISPPVEKETERETSMKPEKATSTPTEKVIVSIEKESEIEESPVQLPTFEKDKKTDDVITMVSHSEEKASLNDLDKDTNPEEPVIGNGMDILKDKSTEFLKHEREVDVESDLKKNNIETFKTPIPIIKEQVLESEEEKQSEPAVAETEPSYQPNLEKTITSTLPTPVASVETTSSQEEYTIENVEVNIGIGFSQSDSLDETNKTVNVIAEFIESSDENLSHTHGSGSFETENVSDVPSGDFEVIKSNEASEKISDIHISKKIGKRKTLKKESHIDVQSPEKKSKVVVDSDKNINITPETFGNEVMIVSDASYKTPIEPHKLTDLNPSQQMEDQMFAQTISTGGIVESFESFSNIEEEGTSSHLNATIVQPVIHQIRRSKRIIRKVVIIDGKEHVSEMVIEEPEQIISSTSEQDLVPKAEDFSGSYKSLSYSEVNTSRQVVMHSRKRITKTVKIVNGNVLVEETETTPDEMEIVTLEEPSVSIIQYDEDKGDSEELTERPTIIEVPEETVEEKRVSSIADNEQNVVSSEKTLTHVYEEYPKIIDKNVIKKESISSTSVPITEQSLLALGGVINQTSPTLFADQDSDIGPSKNISSIVSTKQQETIVSSSSHMSSDNTEKTKEKFVPSKSLSFGSESSDSCYADIQVKVSVPEEISLSVGIKKPKGKKKTKDLKKKTKEMKHNEKHINEPSSDNLNTATVKDMSLAIQKSQLQDVDSTHHSKIPDASMLMTAQFLETEVFNYDTPSYVKPFTKQDRPEPDEEKLSRKGSSSSSIPPQVLEISPNDEGVPNKKQEIILQYEKILPEENTPPNCNITKPQDIETMSNDENNSEKNMVEERIFSAVEGCDSEQPINKPAALPPINVNEKVISQDAIIEHASPQIRKDDTITIQLDSLSLKSTEPELITEDSCVITETETKPEENVKTDLSTVEIQQDDVSEPLHETIIVSTTLGPKKGRKSRKGSKNVENAEPKPISKNSRNISQGEEKIASIKMEVAHDQTNLSENTCEPTSDIFTRPTSTEVSKGKQTKKRKNKKTVVDIIKEKEFKDGPSSITPDIVSKSEPSHSKVNNINKDEDFVKLKFNRKVSFSDDTQIISDINKKIQNDNVEFIAPCSSQKMISQEIVGISADTLEVNTEHEKLKDIHSLNKELGGFETSPRSPLETNCQLQVTTSVETDRGHPIINVIKSSLNDLSTSLMFEDNVVNVSVTTEEEKVNDSKEIAGKPKLDISLSSDSSNISSDLNDTVIEVKPDSQPEKNIETSEDSVFASGVLSTNKALPILSTVVSDSPSHVLHDSQHIELKDKNKDLKSTSSDDKIILSKDNETTVPIDSSPPATTGENGLQEIIGDIEIHVHVTSNELLTVSNNTKEPKLRELGLVCDERDQLPEIKSGVHDKTLEEKNKTPKNISDSAVFIDDETIKREITKDLETSVSGPSSEKQGVTVPMKSDSVKPNDTVSLSYSLEGVMTDLQPSIATKEIENVEDLTIHISEMPSDSGRSHVFVEKEADARTGIKELEETDLSEFIIVTSTSDDKNGVVFKGKQDNFEAITSDPVEPKCMDHPEKTCNEENKIIMKGDLSKESGAHYSSKPSYLEGLKSSKEISDDLLQTIKERIVNVNTPSFVGLLSDLDNTVRRKEMNYNLDLLKNSCEEEKESVIVTTIILISEYLETITYIIINSKKYDRDVSNVEEKLQQVSLLLNDLNMLKDGIACLRANGGNKELLDALETQADGVTNILDQTGANVNSKATEKQEMLKKSKDILCLIQKLSGDIENLEKDQSITAEKKLKKLDKLEVLNADYETQVSLLLKKHPTQADLINSSQLLSANEELLSGLRVSLLQSLALAQEYQDTLVELENVSEVAKTIVASRVIVPSLQELQNEMQKERKFFISLSHCRSILESLESSLDEETRTANAKLHSRIHNIASEVLDTAGERAVALALGASRWTLLEQGLAEERGWLRVARERVPSLSGVSTSDYHQYLSLNQSLMNDIELHSAKIWKLLETAHTLQGLISCSGLEESCEALRSTVANLEEQVSDNIRKLTEFRDIWIGYENSFLKLSKWVDFVIKNYVPPLDIQSFWELKAEYEVQKMAYSDLCTRFNNAMKILPVTDEPKQADNLKELSHKWDIVINRLEEVEVAIPSDLSSGEKLEIIEARLKQMEDSLNSYQDISNEEELDLYVGKLHVLKEGASNIEEELLRYGLGPASERRRLASLQGRTRILITQSSVEYSAAVSLRDRIVSIRNGINRISRVQNKALKVLDQWEPTIDGSEDVVRQALVNVKEVVKSLCDERMEISWLRETVSRLPFGIKPRLGLVNIEKEIAALSETHVSLSNRAEDLLALILSRLHLWDNYGVKLETVRSTVREADYMMELLRIDGGPIDLPRIVKASSRLQGVKESLTEREGGLEELRAAGQSLEAVVRAEVGERLRAEVREEEAAWARAEAGLGDLATRYRKAAGLWSRYREALSAAELPPTVSSLTLEEWEKKQEAVKHVQELADQIAQETGIEGILAPEVSSLTRKLAEAKEIISPPPVEPAVKLREQLIEAIQEKLNRVPEGSTTEKLISLRNSLLDLGKADAQLSNIASSSEPDVPLNDLLQLWEKAFRQTFKNYHQLSSQIAKTEDFTTVVNLWKDYLIHVRHFLDSDLPQHYHELHEHNHLCQVHHTVLSSQKSLLPAESSALDHNTVQQLNLLTNMHNETLVGLMEKQKQIEARITVWDKYRQDQTNLMDWLKNMEKERNQLKLRYIHSETIAKTIAKIEELLMRIAEGESLELSLKEQLHTIIPFCDESVSSSLQIEQASLSHRLSNLHAALLTWKDYLEKVKSNIDLYEKHVQNVENSIDKIQNILVKENKFNVDSDDQQHLENKLHTIMTVSNNVKELSKEVESLEDAKDILKDSLSPTDLKTMTQRCWLLSQQQNEFEHQLTIAEHVINEKLQIAKVYNQRASRFLSWLSSINHKLSTLPNDAASALSIVEREIRAEVALKRSEADWLTLTGKDIRNTDIPQQVTEGWSILQESLNSIIEKLSGISKGIPKLAEEMDDLRVWIHEMETKLSTPIVLKQTSKKFINNKIKEHKVIQDDIESKSTKVKGILKLCESLLTDCECCNITLDVEAITLAMANLESRWKNISSLSSQRKLSLENLVSVLEKAHKLAEEQKVWLNESDKKITSLEKQLKCADLGVLPDIEENVAKQVIDLNSGNSGGLSEVDDMYLSIHSEYKLPEEILKVPENLLKKWEELKRRANELSAEIRTRVTDREQWTRSAAKAVAAMAKVDALLTLAEVQESHEVEEIEKSLQNESETLRQADLSGLKVMKWCSEDDVVKIQATIDEYQSLWKDINERLSKIKLPVEDESVKTIVQCEDQSVEVNTLRFETDQSIQVDTLGWSPPIARKGAFSEELIKTTEELEVLLTKLADLSQLETQAEINKCVGECESNYELAKHLSETLIDQCSASREEALVDRIKYLGERFDFLRVSALKKQNQLRETSARGRLTCPLCSNKNWQQLDNDLWRLEQWLQYAEGSLSSQPSNPPSSIEQLEDVIQDQRELLLDLDSHRSLVVSMNIVGTHLAEHTEDEVRAKELRNRLMSANKQWEQVCELAAAWQAKLQTALMQNHEFHDTMAELTEWLEKTETSIRQAEPIDLTDPTQVIEAKYSKFKEMQEEVERCEARVRSLEEAARQVLSDGDRAIERLGRLRLRLISLSRLISSYINSLSAALGHHPPANLSPLHLSQQLLDNASLGNEQPTSGDEVDTSTLLRCHRFLGRVIRASLPISAFLLFLLGAASFVPVVEQDFNCANSFLYNMAPVLRYPYGRPPT